MPDEYDYYINKLPDRTYISRSFPESSFDSDDERKLRIISKVFDEEELHEFVLKRDEMVLYVTPAARQEVKAVFYEDSRKVKSLTIQRFSRVTGKPFKKTHFTFSGESLEKLYKFLRAIKYISLDKDEKVRLDDEILDDLLVTADEKRKFLLSNLDLVEEIARNNITESDVIALAYRKRQLELFEQLLYDKQVFERYRERWSKRGAEAVWQQFFEHNPWIFGYGLNYIFTSRLDDKKLEQVVSGYNFAQSGKRVDALMRTRGIISSLCFIEIKTHTTPLLSSGSYRSESWPVSDKLSGSISQIQKTVQKAVKEIETRVDIHTSLGDPTGESAFLYQPKSYVVIGSLKEFVTEHGVNEQKFSSFELFRRNITSPEIITFDELFERAKFIVQYSESNEPPPIMSTSENDIPF